MYLNLLLWFAWLGGRENIFEDLIFVYMVVISAYLKAKDTDSILFIHICT